MFLSINEKYGDAVWFETWFETLSEMENAIAASGYAIADCGLREGVDFIADDTE